MPVVPERPEAAAEAAGKLTAVATVGAAAPLAVAVRDAGRPQLAGAEKLPRSIPAPQASHAPCCCDSCNIVHTCPCVAMAVSPISPRYRSQCCSLSLGLQQDCIFTPEAFVSWPHDVMSRCTTLCPSLQCSQKSDIDWSCDLDVGKHSRASLVAVSQ